MTCVLAFHFIPGIDRYAPLGTIGVRLFFVLSGFLITRILLASRQQEFGQALRSFYTRRSLRIFPVFYLTLAVAWLMNIGAVRSTLAWHVSYLTNAYLFDRGGWHGAISHLWSLAVEEQFYLVWPWLILWLPERWLQPMIVAMMISAPASRLAIGGPMNSVLPTSCLDSLGAGALLALPQTRSLITQVGGWAGPPLLAIGLLLRYSGAVSIPVEVTLDLGVSLTAAWLVGAATDRRLGSVLRMKPMVYLGTISYAVYLFHGFMPYILGRYVAGFAEMPTALRFALLSTTTVALASLSWRVFEAPFMALKERTLNDRRTIVEHPSELFVA